MCVVFYIFLNVSACILRVLIFSLIEMNHAILNEANLGLLPALYFSSAFPKILGKEKQTNKQRTSLLNSV